MHRAGADLLHDGVQQGPGGEPAEYDEDLEETRGDNVE